jgi:hypothetical protein
LPVGASRTVVRDLRKLDPMILSRSVESDAIAT